MCQLILKEEGKTIHRAALKFCWKKNGDGAGFAYVEGGKVIISKGHMYFQDFWDAYEPHQNKRCVIHFRLASHGSRCAENTHPFEITPNFVMGHNGILMPFTPWSGDQRSDTRIFVEDHLQKVMHAINVKTHKQWIPWLIFTVNPFMSGNRLVFLTPDNYWIVNEKAGDWVDKVWYSNGDPNKRFYGINLPKGWNTETVGENGVVVIGFEEDKEMRDFYKDQEPINWSMGGSRGPITIGPGSPGKNYQTGKKYNTTTDSWEWGDYRDAEEEDQILGIGVTHRHHDELPWLKMVYDARKAFDAWSTNNLTEHEWHMALGLLDKAQFDKLRKVIADRDGADEDIDGILKQERGKAIVYVDDIKRVTQEKEIVIGKGSSDEKRKRLKFPPWLEEQFKNSALLSAIEPSFAVSLAHCERGFILDGRIVSRAAVKKVLSNACEVPSERGLWKPIKNSKGVVTQYEMVAGPNLPETQH